MTMPAWQSLVMILIIAATTTFIRALPFLLFPAGRKTPAIIAYLGQVLPFAIIGMLIIYCLKDFSISGPAHGLPEVIGVAAVAGLYLWRGNTLLSIAGGSILYMVLVQVVFVQ